MEKLTRDQHRWVTAFNRELDGDVMHGLQWCDLDDVEQTYFLRMAALGMTPAEALMSYAEGGISDGATLHKADD
jgi:hypothetical protein